MTRRLGTGRDQRMRVTTGVHSFDEPIPMDGAKYDVFRAVPQRLFKFGIDGLHFADDIRLDCGIRNPFGGEDTVDTE